METNDTSPKDERRNTFLSRVFGAEFSEVSNSLDTAEMSHFPIKSGDLLSNDTIRTCIIESDQESAVEDEDDCGYSLRGHPQFFNGVQSIIAEDSEIENEEDDDLSDQDLDETHSMLKLDQGESTNSDNEANDSSAKPLFKKKPSLYDNILNTHDNLFQVQNPKRNDSLLFQRLMRDKSQKLFGKDNKIQDESFLFRKRGIHEENDKPKFKLKKPSIFPNINHLRNTPAHRVSSLSPREKALWKWANVENLDIFLQDVYRYYLGNGFTCMVIEKVLNLITLLFVVFISTYMGHCINYSQLPKANKFEDIIIDKCYSTQITKTFMSFLWIFYGFVVLKIIQMYFDIKILRDIHNFYSYLLNISDDELQTIPWQSVIQQIVYLKDQNAVTANVVEVKAKSRIDAHDIANRIMRKENYLIGLYNKDVLNLSLPLPLYRANTLTKTLEWNLNLCIMGFAFNDSGYLKQNFLKESQREYLSEELRKRFILAGLLNIILSPFLVTYFLLLYFFRYFNEYKTTPAAISMRQYTPIAEWKFREYNELYHLFQKRIGLSVEVANKYISQFPNAISSYILKFFKFISGSFVAILGLMTILDPENFLNFEITNDKTVLFYMTVLGTIWAICHSAIDDQYKVFDPEDTLRELISYTHYSCKEWEGKYHTEQIKQEFCKLYCLRFVLLLREVASLIMTPFILWFSLPKSAEDIIDYFREESVYVDGLGYVCRHAMFEVNDYKKHKSRQHRHKILDHQMDNSNSDYSTEDEFDNGTNKMIQSYMYFIDNYQNSDNAVGKYQLPKHMTKIGPEIPQINHNYSWKKQFQLGSHSPISLTKASKSFGKHSTLSNKHIHGLTTKPSEISFHNEDAHGYLGESFINSIPDREFTRSDRSVDTMNRDGMLGLLTQYYRKSDVGR